MSLAISNSTLDETTGISLEYTVALPDAGTSVKIAGAVSGAGGVKVAITGSPISAPANPGSGSIFYIIQVNTTTGAATLLQSTEAYPVVEAGNIEIFRQTLIPGAVLSNNATSDTPELE